jgi:alpha-D-ribose 1-methylphosphonate 5-triphosphate synthase subunit PhnG
MNERIEPGPAAGSFSHADALDILAASDPEAIKAFAETLIDALGPIEVVVSRTGLAMLPYVDTVQNTAFHLGEVLVAEAHIRLPERGMEGYGAIVGRDLEQAMAMAVIDATLAASIDLGRIENFLTGERHRQIKADEIRLRKVESTRVRMETF